MHQSIAALTTRAARYTPKLALLILLLFTCTFAFSAESSITNRCGLTPEEAAALNGNAATDVHALRNYTNTIRGMLETEQFQKLDCLADELRDRKERFPGGMWKLHSLYAGLYMPVESGHHPTQQDWTALLQHLRQWTWARPESITARVAMGWAYLEYAWDARGDGYADSVSNNGWKLFQDRTAEASRILHAASTLPTKCPEWYLAMLKLAENENWSAQDARTLYERANAFEPGYYYYARMLAFYLLPRWVGNEGDAERFVEETSDRIGGDQGDYLYFQVANYLICGCSDDLHLSWPRIKKGFETSEKLYGPSMVNLNLMAYMASHYSSLDPAVADKAFSRIGEQWDQDKWGTQEGFEKARKWAADFGPIVARQTAMEDEARANVQTPEGIAYKRSFERTYKDFVLQCIATEGGTTQKFETLIRIGDKGAIEDIRIFWNAPAALCVYQKLHSFQLQKTTPFPPPPHAPYWIRLDLDGSEFAPIAVK